MDAAGVDSRDPEWAGLAARDGGFAKRHRKTLNRLFGTHIAKSPTDSTFRWLLSQLDVEGFESLLQQWIATQPDVPEVVDLVCGGNTLRGSIAGNATGAARFIAQVSMYSSTQRMADGGEGHHGGATGVCF